MTVTPSLSVILPVFNGAGWIGRCLTALDAALTASHFEPREIVLVDDGSTDTTVAEAQATTLGTPLRVVSQPNRGRFLARRTGLENARHEHVLFVDTRVLIDAKALAFAAHQLDEPDAQVWTAHVEIETSGNSLSRFWRAIEHVAWRRYFEHPRLVRYGIDEFDFYPKGTTALLCPRRLIQDAYDAFTPSVADWSKVNDDTALLRYVAERTPISISPDYSCTYHARSTLRSFLRHAHHRGSVLIDGYLRPGTRFAIPIAAVLAASPIGVVVAVKAPMVALAAGVAGSAAAGVVVAAKGAQPADAALLGALSVPFGMVYLAGMWRGVASRVALHVPQRRTTAAGRA